MTWSTVKLLLKGTVVLVKKTSFSWYMFTKIIGL